MSTVLQAVGARREPRSQGLDPALLMQLVRQGPFLAGTLLDIVAVGFTVVALRNLPLFVVQAAIAASLAVTALVDARWFHTRLARIEWAAVGGVAMGLVLLALSAGPEAPPHATFGEHLVLLGVIVAVAVAGIGAARLDGSRGAAALGALAGVAYGTANTALRIIRHFDPSHLIRNLAAYVAVGGAVTGLLLFATALQRGAVTVANGALIVTETLLPALFGAFVLGERPRAGWLPVAVVGFVVTVTAAATLSRFGEGPEPITPYEPNPQR